MDERFNENTFTFQVGPSKKSFVVHADIISPHSRVLRRLIEGAFKESIEKHAVLPEVDPETFGHFLAYAYFMSSCTSANEITLQTSSTQRAPTSRLIELLLANEHKKFKCKSCYATPQLEFSLSFPQCGKCYQIEFRPLKWKAHCIVFGCQGNGEYIQGLFCQKCLTDLDVLKVRTWSENFTDDGARKLQLSLPGRLEELQDFQFNVPLRVKDILGATKDFIPFPFSATANLLDTVRLAIFADIYEVEQLSQAALMTLYQKLTQELLDEKSIASICEVANVVYDNTTYFQQETSSKGTHVLRRILSEFIAAYRGRFTASRTFMQLLCQGGELAGDILLATIPRGESSA